LSSFALLHGGGQGGWVWDEVARLLRDQGAEVITLDVPGCGTKRERDTLTLTVEQVADELLADIAKAFFGPVTLVGHSQAGTMLPVMWRRSSELLNQLVYLGCCAPLPGQNVVEMMGEGAFGDHPDQVGWVMDPAKHERLKIRRMAFCNDMSEAQADAFMARLVSDQWPPLVTFAAHWDYDDLAGSPSSYIVCKQDQALPEEWQRRFAERLHCRRIVELDAGHQAMTTQPEQVAAMLLDLAAQRLAA
jgi:pimeloyl-ACP methyl ester carboxylesterase